MTHQAPASTILSVPHRILFAIYLRLQSESLKVVIFVVMFERCTDRQFVVCLLVFCYAWTVLVSLERMINIWQNLGNTQAQQLRSCFLDSAKKRAPAIRPLLL